jgi:hypothetical protein
MQTALDFQESDDAQERECHMMKIEYLIAKDDRTWDTIIEEVPESVGTDREALVKWAEDNLAGQSQYRNVVLFAVYCVLESVEPE